MNAKAGMAGVWRSLLACAGLVLLGGLGQEHRLSLSVAFGKAGGAGR